MMDQSFGLEFIFGWFGVMWGVFLFVDKVVKEVNIYQFNNEFNVVSNYNINNGKKVDIEN
jgi:hypoxanthine-guanine phosphoribosyltransferase